MMMGDVLLTPMMITVVPHWQEQAVKVSALRARRDTPAMVARRGSARRDFTLRKAKVHVVNVWQGPIVQ